MRNGSPSFRTSRRARWLAPALGLLAAAGFWGLPAHAETYALGPQDKVKVNVVEWYPGTSELRSPINGEYTISPAGTIFLPLLGEVQAAGSTEPALANAIAELMQAKLSLSQRPSTSVEIAQFRPFYVMGDVDRPGEFAFRPGMTVLQAVSIAGGFYRKPGGGGAPDDAASTRAELRGLLEQIDELAVRQARLTSELAGAKGVDFPAELRRRTDDPELVARMRLEEALFESRSRAFQASIDTQRKLAALYDREVQALQAQAVNLKQQEDAVQRRAEGLGALQAKGLSAPGRELEVERLLSDVSAKQREVDVRSLRVQEERVRAEETLLKFDTQRRQEIATDLQATRSRLAEARRRAEKLQRAVAEQDRTPGRTQSGPFSITRKASGAEAAMPASESTPLHPGDVLTVQLGVAAPAVR
ncbi:polysaccharide biosynthesis/export family protein [Alsobacter sp. SYSU BS001988]